MSFFGNALGGNPFSTPVGSRIGKFHEKTRRSNELCCVIKIDLIKRK
jgi:hypothetical protein